MEFQHDRSYLIAYKTVAGSWIEQYMTYNDHLEPVGRLAFTLATGETVKLFEHEIVVLSVDPPRPDLVTVIQVEMLLDGDYDVRAANKLLDNWLRDADEHDSDLISYSISDRSAYTTHSKKV